MIECRNEILAIEPYIPGKHIDEVKREFGLTNIIKLASNENPLGPAPSALEAMMRSLQTVNLYPDGNSTVLKDTLASKLGITPENLIVGNGSDEILKLIAESYLSTNSHVVIAEPTFSEYEFVAKLMGAAITRVPLKEYRHDLAAMLGAINKQTKIVFVCNPNNPTGTIVTNYELEQFIKKVPENVLVVVDEAYYEYVQAADYPQTIGLLNKYPNIIVTRTFSKVYALAALRIGYGIAHPGIINHLNRVKEPFNVNSLAQIAATASLLDNVHVQKSVALNEEGKEFLYDEFELLGLEYVPTETNFILVDVGQDAFAVFKQLLTKGVIIRSAHVFKLPNHIRVTVGTAPENKLFISALKEVLKR